MLAAQALLATLACGCGERGGVHSGGALVSDRGRIAFTRATDAEGKDIESDVYMIDANGTRETRLTDEPGLDGMASWSPNGRRIAFVSDRDGKWEIYTMAPDGTDQRRLTHTAVDEGAPTFSPDGKEIAYLVDPFGDPTIYSSTGEGRLYLMDADGSHQRPLPGISLIGRISGNADGEEPAFSPDGKRIAFAATAGKDNEEIYTVNVDGSERTRLTDIPGDDHWPPTWSSDGTRIAFTSEGTENNSEIYVMNADGSGLTKLTDAPADDAFPAWRP